MTRLIHYTAFVILMTLLLTTVHAATTWTEQGVYRKFKSSGGSIKYVLATDVAPVCMAQYRCDSDWGLVFNLREAGPSQCQLLAVKKIDLSDSAEYTGFRIVNGQMVCQ